MRNKNIPKKTWHILKKNRSSIRARSKPSLGFILHARTFTHCARRCRRRDASRRRAPLALSSSPPVFRPLNPARGIKGKIYGGVAACSRPNGDDPRSSSLVLARAISRIRSLGGVRAARRAVGTGKRQQFSSTPPTSVLFRGWTCVDEKERHFFLLLVYHNSCTTMFGENWRKGARKKRWLIGRLFERLEVRRYGTILGWVFNISLLSHFPIYHFEGTGGILFDRKGEEEVEEFQAWFRKIVIKGTRISSWFNFNSFESKNC